MFRSIDFPRRSLFLVALLFAALANAGICLGQDLPKWEAFDFATNKIAAVQVSGLTLDELKLVRGIVFGRHGRVFKDASIRKFLESRPWYKPDPAFRNADLNPIERANLDLIRDTEAKKHDQIQPGDMRFYRNRIISNNKIGQHSGAEWVVLNAEIEAIHGKRFSDSQWLQEYFNDRYWYRPSDSYNPKQLSDIERTNQRLIARARKKERRLELSPGDMKLFQDKLITEKMLHGLGLYELRLLRNEVYARHGRLFHGPWLQQYFAEQLWYQPREDYTEPELSSVEKSNVETIVRYESGIHEGLGARPVTKSLLNGLFLEDARRMRQEIYARHGKVFKDIWTQKYFATLDWYKPDTAFTDAALSDLEKRNIAVIAAYEKNAVSAMSVIEG